VEELMQVRFKPLMNRVWGSARVALAVAIAIASPLVAAAPAWSQTSYNSLEVLWTAPGDDADQGQVSGYELRYSTSAVGTDIAGWWNSVSFSQRLTLGPPLASAGRDDSTKVNGLTPGTTYYFVLRAFDDYYNISDYSNVATGTTLSCNAPAMAPTPFAATVVSGDISVTWGATSDTLALSLHLYRAPGTTGGIWTQIQNLPPGTTSYLDTSVSSGATYRYRAAYMGTLCEGPTTAAATVTVPGVAPPPSAATSPSTIHAYPNPASGPIRIVLDVGAAASMASYIRLFDLNGHWVATPVNGTYPPGTTEIPWNRIGRDGRTVGPGYYELIGTVGIARVRERIVLLP
jgi:hypothetical protein